MPDAMWASESVAGFVAASGQRFARYGLDSWKEEEEQAERQALGPRDIAAGSRSRGGKRMRAAVLQPASDICSIRGEARNARHVVGR